MDRLRVRVNFKYITSVFLLVFAVSQSSYAWNIEYALDSGSSSPFRYDVVTLPRTRQRRAATPPPPVTIPTPPASVPFDPAPSPRPANVSTNATPGSNKPANVTDAAAATVMSVTQIPLLGVNGSGILHVNLTGHIPGNLTDSLPKVSDPIVPDDNFTDIFKETPERIKSEENLANLTYDHHNFYNSSFIGNQDYFREYWANITINKAEVHQVLSNSHRRATSIQLSFDFPFYGHNIRNVTVATGGFIYTGEHVHNWLAATQYIAPLMGNFDTTLTNDSKIKLYDDGEKFSAFWENVTLQENTTKKFTFAVTLYKNGDIIFAYKDIPIDVQEINDTEHPVKVGISDAYLTDKIVFYVRRKTIYEYHRVSFKDHLITNNTILKMTALPTCLQYDSCDSCLNHDTGFNCTWCPQIQKCSSGTDRNKQDWLLRKCEKTTIVNATMCPAREDDSSGVPATGNTAYTTDQQAKHDTVVNTQPDAPKPVSDQSSQAAPMPHEARSPLGGAVAAFIAITLICAAASWIFYAFKNPHTRSGQILIKYRPSQWNWRRGEARYTAATIHM
ncbi:plexin domain-containing protein 2 [Helicoverpa zea]|uniref:plexin domain-containing protein 2 n=1 Tax=Helicoverpa zea TaxID=7113 RepID=UPI001F58AC00|nr:plexin domain-containing protein 2 [Helicoverpa zea]